MVPRRDRQVTADLNCRSPVDEQPAQQLDALAGLRALRCPGRIQGADEHHAQDELVLSLALGTGMDGGCLVLGYASPLPCSQSASGMSIAANAGSGWLRMAFTNGPSATTTPRAPIAMAKATYKVS